MGKRALECLIKVGALNSFGSRPALLEALDQMLSVSASHFKAAQSGQLSFFGSFAESVDDIILPFAASLDTREQLEWERELLGLYVSDHPLSPYLPALRRKVTHFSGSLNDVHSKEKVTVAGMVTRFRLHQTKGGQAMGFVTLEDIQGPIELVIFPRTWDRYSKLVVPDRVLVAEGKIDAEGGDPKILVDRLDELDLEEALTVQDFPAVDLNAYVPPAVAAVYGGTAYGEPLVEEEGEESEPDGSANSSAEPAAPYQIPAQPVPQAREPELSPGHQNTPMAPYSSLAAGFSRPGAAKVDDGLPPEPDDWHLYEPPTEDDFYNPGGVTIPAVSPPVAKTPPAPLHQEAELSSGSAAGSLLLSGTAFADVPVNPDSEPSPAEPTPVKARPVNSPPLPSRSPATDAGKSSGDAQAPSFISMPFFALPGSLAASTTSTGASPLIDENTPPRMLTVILRSSNEKERDVRRLKRVHGTLVSFPGRDRFSLLVFEGGRRFLLEFPNESTGICSELIRKLIELAGEGNVTVEPIKFSKKQVSKIFDQPLTVRGSILLWLIRPSRSRRCGNRITSRIEWLSVSSMVRRSMPIPKPPFGRHAVRHGPQIIFIHGMAFFIFRLIVAAHFQETRFLVERII